MTTVLGILAVVAALHLARGVLIPIALAGLLALLMTPLVRRIERFGLGPTVSVIAATTCAFLVACAFALVLALQVRDFMQKIPEYRTNIVAKTASLGVGGKWIATTFEAFEEIDREVAKTAAETSGARPELPVAEVKVVEPAVTPARMVYRLVVAWAEPLGAAVIVLVLVVFLLLYRRDLGDRLVHFFGPGSVNVTSQAIGEAAENVSRYLLAQSTVNGAYGLTVAAGLFGLGVPSALLLGLFAAVLRFIPYVGALLGMVVPLFLSLAVFDGWTRPLVLLIAWILLELATGYIVEPFIYGKKTAVSPLGILVGTLFWAWLWGPAGLVLAVPMTVSLFVLGRNIPQLAFLDTLFGSQTSLEPSVQLYHRLLATDPDAAFVLADEYGKGRPLVEVCDKLLLPALALAEVDRQRETLDDDRSAALLGNLRSVLEILAESGPPAPSKPALDAGDVEPQIVVDAQPIVLIPAADDADEVAAVMLKACLSKAGFASEILSAAASTPDKAQRACGHEDAVICISALAPNATARTRHLYQRIRAKCPRAKIVIGAWATSDGLAAFEERTAPDGKARFASTLADALKEIGALVSPRTVLANSPIRPGTDVGRVRAPSL